MLRLLRIVRIMGKILLWTVLVAVILVSAVLQIIRLPAGQERLRRLVVDQARAYVPGLRVQRIGGDFTSHLVVEGLVLNDRFGGPAISIQRLAISYDLTALLDQTLHIEQIEIVRPSVQLRPAKSGNLNLAELLAPLPEKKEEPSQPSDWALRLDKLRIVTGTSDIQTQPEARIRLRDLDLDLGLRSERDALVLGLRSLRGQATLPDGRKVNAALSVDAAMAKDNVSTTLSLELDGLWGSEKLALKLGAAGPLSRVALDSRINLPGEGSIGIKGWVGLDAGGLASYQLDTTLNHIDPDRLWPNLIPADINLAFRVTGSGVPLEQKSRVRLSLSAQPSRVQDIRVAELQIDGQLHGTQWKLEKLQAHAAGARLQLTGSGTTETVDAQLKLKLPSLARLPIKGLPPNLRGSLSASGGISGSISGPLETRMKLSLEGIGVDRIRLQRADIQADLAGLPAKPHGAVTIEARGLDPGDRRLVVDRATVRVQGQQDRLVLALDASGPRSKAAINAITSIAPDRIAVQLDGLQLRALGYSLALRNQPRLVYRPGKELELPPIRLGILGGEVVLQAVLRERSFPRVEARLELDGLSPAEGLSVSGKLAATVAKKSLLADAKIHLAPHDSTVTLHADLPLRYRGTWPTVDTRQAGKVKLQGQRLALAAINKLAAGLPELDGTVDINAEVSGGLQQPQARLRLGLSNVGADRISGVNGSVDLGLEPHQVRLSTDLALDRQPIVRLDASADVDVVQLIKKQSLPRDLDLPVRLSLVIPPTVVGSLSHLHPALQQIDGTLAANLDLQGTLEQPKARLRLTINKARMGPTSLGDLTTDITVGVSPRLTQLVVAAQANGRPLLHAQGKGIFDLSTLQQITSAPVSLDLEIPSIDLSHYKHLGPPLDSVAGTLGVTARVRGTLEAPRAEAQIQLKRVRYEKVSIGDLLADTSYGGDRLSSTFKLDQSHDAWLKGQLVLALGRKRPLSANIKGHRLDLGFLHKLAPAVKESGGKLNLDLRASGDLAQPRVNGSVRLQQGQLRLSGMSAFEDIDLALGLSPRRVELSRLNLRSGKGRLEASGGVDLVDLKPTRFALKTRADQFVLDMGAMQKATFSGGIDLQGGLEGSKLSASVHVKDGVLKMPTFEGQRDLHSTGALADVVYTDQEAQTVDGELKTATAPVGLNIAARADPLFVRGEELDLEVGTNLKAFTDPRGRVRISGQLEIRRGRIKVLGNFYDVRQATVSFSGEPQPDPAINVLLARRIADVEVLVGLQGTASSPELILRSNPPIYDRSQVLSLIITGRLDPKAGESESDQTMVLANAVSQVLIGNLTRKIAPKVGLDVARVNLGEQKDKDTGESKIRAEAEVGKYLTERVYVGYRRVFGATAEENTNEGLLEYRISVKWLLMGLFGDAGVGGLDLMWTHRF